MDKLLPAGGLSLLLGKPKVGKSTLARCLLVSVARGGTWLGRKCTQGPTVYLALEEKRSEVRRHFASLGAPGVAPIYCWIDRPPADLKPQEFIRGVMESCRPRLVVVDPLAFLTKVSDNSDYAEVISKLGPIVDVVRDTETHVVLVHHSRKAEGHHGDEALGSTGYLGAVDTAVSLRREINTPAGGIGARTVYSINRYGTDLESTVLLMDEDGWVNVGSTVEELASKSAEDAVLDALKTLEGWQRPDNIRKEAAISDTKARTALNALTKAGVVLRTGVGRRGDPAVYQLSTPNSPI